MSSRFVYCQINGKKEFSLYGDAGCVTMQFQNILYKIYFGEISIALSVTIIAVSIFGRIKEDYRWFIFNQSIWELVNSLIYNCGRIIFVESAMTCENKYWFVPGEPYIGANQNISLFLDNTIRFFVYPSLFLLSFSRFLTIFYSNIYETFFRNRRILFTIVIFTIVNIFFNSGQLFLLAQEQRYEFLTENMSILEKYSSNNSAFSDFWYRFFYYAVSVVNKTSEVLSIIYMSFSIIFSLALVIRILIQAKFQLKQNRRDFFSSIRITSVILLQTILLAFYLTVYLTKWIPYYLKDFNMLYNDFRWPVWMDALHSIDTEIRQLRIFLECIVVLLIMTGYREAIKSAVIFIYFVLRHPKEAVHKYKNRTTGNRVVSLVSMPS